jgi:hypothetical protein
MSWASEGGSWLGGSSRGLAPGQVRELVVGEGLRGVGSGFTKGYRRGGSKERAESVDRKQRRSVERRAESRE